MNQAVLELLVQMRDEASSGLSSLGDGLKSLGGLALGGAVAGFAALGVAVAGGVSDAREAALIMAQTEAVIKSTGGAAGVSAQQVSDYAASLSAAAGQSLFGDSQIQESTNLLLTFTNIKDTTLEAATAISVDMAQALGGAPKDAAIQLGKALNDPIAGVTALSRVGVSFTEEQKAQIKTMQEAGDTAGAQAIILAELNKEFGGSAKAAADADGGMAQFKDTIGETFENVGSKLLPVLNQFAAWLNSPEVQQAIAVFGEQLANGIVVAADFIANTLVPAIVDLYNWLAPILGPIITEVARALREDLPKGIALVAAGWQELKRIMADFKTNYIDPIVRGWEAITTAVTTAWDWLSKVGDMIGGIQIPSWLQGHSPPPLANWFTDIANAAEQAGDMAGMVAPPGGTLPAIGGGGAIGGAAASPSITIVVQGSVTTERDLVQIFREELLRLGRSNLDIFGGRA
jgi:hypothetical protein